MAFYEDFRPADYINQKGENDLTLICDSGMISPLQDVTNGDLANRNFRPCSAHDIHVEYLFVVEAIKRVEATVKKWNKNYEGTLDFLSCGLGGKTDWELYRQARREIPLNKQLLHALQERRRLLMSHGK